MDGANRLGEVGRADVLEQIARGSCLERAEEVVVAVEARQCHNSRRADSVDEALDRLDAADARHPDVHEHHIGKVQGDLFERLLAAERRADDIDAGSGGQDAFDAGDDHRIVVDNDDTDRGIGVGHDCNITGGPGPLRSSTGGARTGWRQVRGPKGRPGRAEVPAG